VSVEDSEHSGRLGTGKTTEDVGEIWELIHEDVAEQSMSWQRLLESVMEFARRQTIWTCTALLLHHDNTPTHTSLKTTEFVTNNNLIIVFNPSYSTDLAPCDFALFLKLKMKLKGWHFETVSHIQRDSQAVFDSIKENDFHTAFEAWKKWWDHCLYTQGSYSEGDGNQNQ
jgi:transposase